MRRTGRLALGPSINVQVDSLRSDPRTPTCFAKSVCCDSDCSLADDSGRIVVKGVYTMFLWASMRSITLRVRSIDLSCCVGKNQRNFT